MLKENKKDYLKRLIESADNVDAPEVNEYITIRSRNKYFNDLVRTNMVIFRRKCKDQLMRYKEENHIKGSWKNILIKRLGLESWEEVKDTWICEIIDGGSCDEVIDCLDDEFVKIHYGILGGTGQTDKIHEYDGNKDQLTWSSGSSYKSKKTLTENDKTDRVKKFERSDSVLFNEDKVVNIDDDIINDGGNKMGVKFLDEIGVNRITKRTSKKDIDDKNRKQINNLDAYRKSMSGYIKQIQSNINGEGDGYGKNVLNAVTKNNNTGNYEISMVRNNVPVMWGNSRYLEIDGDISEVSSKLGLIADAVSNGKLDSVLKIHKKRVASSKKTTKS